MPDMAERDPRTGMAQWRTKLYDVIFEADTPMGKGFDIVLLVAIVASILVVVLDSVQSYRAAFGEQFRYLEWFFTALFTVEYGLRLLSAPRPLRYARSFFGVIDLLAVLPTYLSLFFVGSHYMMVVRSLRLVRVFRVFKLGQYVGQARVLGQALRQSRHKITVFVVTVLTVVIIVAALMYVIEGPESGFDNLPRAMYWAIVTLTTVGYGDIAPRTALGQLLASVVMFLGYAIIAVPTGIVSVELANAQKSVEARTCGQCMKEGHDQDAEHCKYCGARLP
ncbi:MAG: ion transporter [Pseudomonadota bacterium]